MTRLILVRHGQSEANLLNIFAGHSDFPLTEIGRTQARLAANYISNSEKPCAVYASDLLRAYETGETIANALGLPTVKDEHFREIYGGEWESMPYAKISEKYPEAFAVWRNEYPRSCPVGGEATAEVYRRVVPYLKELGKRHDGECIVIASHATVIRSIEAAARGYGEYETDNVPFFHNAAISIYSYDANTDTLSVIRSDITEHLEGAVTSLPPIINA